MQSIQEMAHAHLITVQKALQDLKTQKDNIDNEIKKLSSYLDEGIKVLNNESITSAGGVVEKNDNSHNKENV